MLRLADLQDAFSSALLDSELPPPAAIGDGSGRVDGKRFNVYRNNVIVSLVDTLATVYPAIERLVGEEFFRAAAGLYVRNNPPQSPLMFDYGGGFADFLETFEPAQSVPYLGDVARLEWGWNKVYHANDAAVLDPSALTAVGAERLDGVRFVFHPAAAIIVSRFPVVTLFEANRNPAVEPIAQLPDHGEAALVTRPDIDVEVHRLSTGCAQFLQHLSTGDTLAEAAASAYQSNPHEFDLGQSLTLFLQSGAAAELSE